MDSLPFPRFDQLMRPVLDHVVDCKSIRMKQLREEMLASSGLSQEQKTETIPSGALRYYDRIVWATTFLVKAGALERPQRGYVQITERGRQLLKESGPVTVSRLKQFNGWNEAWGNSNVDAKGADPATTTSEELADGTPEELIQKGIKTLDSDIRGDLLSRVKGISPEAFENLVLQLLGGLGYGTGPESRKGVKRGPDGGIDGRIDEDKLGLASIYIQAKRYQDASVGRPAIQSFYGAMGGHGASKGVFITTSGFTREALDCAKDYRDKKIVLIDGSRLTQLMLEAGIGVSVKYVYKVYRIDEDFFAAFDE